MKACQCQGWCFAVTSLTRYFFWCLKGRICSKSCDLAFFLENDSTHLTCNLHSKQQTLRSSRWHFSAKNFVSISWWWIFTVSCLKAFAEGYSNTRQYTGLSYNFYSLLGDFRCLSHSPRDHQSFMAWVIHLSPSINETFKPLASNHTPPTKKNKEPTMTSNHRDETWPFLSLERLVWRNRLFKGQV